MLETQVKVVKVEPGFAWVELTKAEGCSQCAGKGCGASKMSQAFCSKPKLFQVQNEIAAREGDLVIVASADGAILQGVILAYGIPLLGLIFGALLGLQFANSSAQQQDLFAALGAVLGLLSAVLVSKQIGSLQSTTSLPKIIRHVLS